HPAPGHGGLFPRSERLGIGIRVLRGPRQRQHGHPPRQRARRQGTRRAAPARSPGARTDRARAVAAEPRRWRRAAARPRFGVAIAMTEHDPLAAWRNNPFFVLEVATDAPPADVERAGQRLIALLTVGSTAAAQYSTPFGPATRDADLVRQALAALRDPVRRAVEELGANVAQGAVAQDDGQALKTVGDTAPWEEAERAIGWRRT